jgi:hypothetical protein
VLKLHSDQTDSVSVDLHQRRLNAAGVPFSFDNTCGRLRSPERKSRHSIIMRYRRQSAMSCRWPTLTWRPLQTDSSHPPLSAGLALSAKSRQMSRAQKSRSKPDVGRICCELLCFELSQACPGRVKADELVLPLACSTYCRERQVHSPPLRSEIGWTTWRTKACRSRCWMPGANGDRACDDPYTVRPTRGNVGHTGYCRRSVIGRLRIRRSVDASRLV